MKKKINDIKKINDAYSLKCEEYNKLSVDELKVVYNNSKTNKSKRIGGTYLKAFMDVISRKLQEESIKNSIENTKDIISQESISETTTK